LIKGYLLDTNVLGELERNGGDPIVQAWLRPIMIGNLFTSAISIGELQFGIEKLPEGKRRSELNMWLDDIKERFTNRTLDFDQPSALIWGNIRAHLRRFGQEKPTIDLQIAATALRHGLPVVTRNTKHFEGLGLVVINPWSDEAFG
jgi:predicted nucleic acid-binding protein